MKIENYALGELLWTPGKTPHFRCSGPGFNPWLGNYTPHAATKDPICLNEDMAQKENYALELPTLGF